MPSDAAAAGPAPYADLTPGGVLDALDAVGLRGDGRLIQLNSYENRVFQVFLEDGRVVVAKFYRPGALERRADPRGARLRGRARARRDPGRRAARARARRRARRTPRAVASAGADAGALTTDAGGAYRFGVSRAPAPAARPSSRTPRCAAGSAASSAACTRSARARRSRIGMTLDVATYGDGAAATSCSRTTSSPTDVAERWRGLADAGARRLPRRLRRRRRRASCACTATAIPATCSGPTPARTSSTSTTPSTARRCRTCGCCSRATARR